ncbi:MAG: cytochrome c [Chlorobi bacterium]|nr:cytochrome c [Chlorobiota bacterium]
MKKTTPTIYSFILLIGILFTSCNEEKTNKQNVETATENHNHSEMMQNMKNLTDNRISLNLSPEKAQHQLMNMRSHVVAVQSIINYLSKDEFEKASEVAASKLGLTDEMKMMCTSFNNEEFERLGLEFHNNADKMSQIFKAKDKNKSLEALSTTMTSCITCHATFKQ